MADIKKSWKCMRKQMTMFHLTELNIRLPLLACLSHTRSPRAWPVSCCWNLGQSDSHVQHSFWKTGKKNVMFTYTYTVVVQKFYAIPL